MTPTDKFCNVPLGIPESQAIAHRLLRAALAHMDCAVAWSFSCDFDREKQEIEAAADCASRAAVYLRRGV